MGGELKCPKTCFGLHTAQPVVLAPVVSRAVKANKSALTS